MSRNVNGRGFSATFEPGTDGVVDLVLREQRSSVHEPVERARLGFTPEELDALLTQGRTALWSAIGLYADVD